MELNRITGQGLIQQSQAAVSNKTSAPERAEAETQKDKVSISGKDGEQQPDPAIKPHKKWLFFNYIAADCNLTQFQLLNIDQQEKIGSDENTHITAFVDVGPKTAPVPFGSDVKEGEPEAKPGDWSGARTIYITKDNKEGVLNSEVIATHGDHVDTSNWEVMANAITDAIKKFPADNIAVIFNDHGGGFTGAMSDDTDGGFTSIPDIKKAFAKVKEETGKEIDIIGFDACLMAETEVAYPLREYGKIMLASEENEGGPGWTYDSMLGGRTMVEAISLMQQNLYKKINVTPREFAKIVVDVNRQHNEDIPTFSAIDLKEMDNLKNSTDKLAKTIIDTKDKESIKNAINASENYGGGWSPYGDIRDLHHLCRNIISTSTDEKVKKAAEEVKASVEKTVFANEVNPEQHPESKGLSIYAPSSGKMSYEYPELSFAKDTSWDEALESLGVKHDPNFRGHEVWPDGSARKYNKK